MKLKTKEEYVAWRMANTKDIISGKYLNKKQASKGYANYERNFVEERKN